MSLLQDQEQAEESIRKYQVFISSTFRDLAEQRRIVLDVVVERGHMPIAIERFPAIDITIPAVIHNAMKACQIYIVILGYRYGSLINDQSISFSQLEYEMAYKQNKVVVPFILVEDEVINGRKILAKNLEQLKIKVAKLAPNILERKEIIKEIKQLKTELANEDKLWKFRSLITSNRLSQLFSLEKKANDTNKYSTQFDKYIVEKALNEAEKVAIKNKISGWIKEPEDRSLTGTIEAVSRNRFLVDVIGAMAKFDTLVPRIRDNAAEKEAAASFFTDKYLQQIIARNGSLFFESGSSITYVAQIVGERLKEYHNKEIQISTNNILAYLIFWLVRGIKCSLFPWGPPEQHYGAVFGPINDLVPENRKPSFPPDRLSIDDQEAIKQLHNAPFGPSQWTSPTLMLGALSGLQLALDLKISNCVGPHVGSPRNKVFKRFMYDTKLPLMLFMTANKINSPVDIERCHFILDQRENENITWKTFLKDYPIAFCVGCENKQDQIKMIINKFEELQLKIIRPEHKTLHTAFIARNQKFIEVFEEGMNIQ